MITRVNTVLVGKNCPASYTNVDALNAGDVALFDENRSLITTAAAAAKAASIYVGVAKNKIKVTMPDGSVAEKANIEFSNEIQKASKPSAVIGTYVAPVEEKITIDLSSAVITVDNRYVLRMVYKDIFEAPGQFTHTYEIYAKTTAAADLAAAFVKKINKHNGRRVQASAAGAVITLTALPKDDNEGVDSLNEYSIVNMEASMYENMPGSILGNYPKSVEGIAISKVTGNPGKGYWKQVRDEEARYMGYKGIVYTGAYPVIEQEKSVEEGANYDYATIENDNLYLSNDNQYIKTTPLTTDLYVKAGSLSGSVVESGIKAFIAGDVASSAAVNSIVE